MLDCFIYDHVRTPRGKGRSAGGLHATPATELSAQTLRALRDRNDLDTALVDDVILGCLTPINEQGACLGRTAGLRAGYDDSVAGIQINRFCGSGLDAVNFAAGQIASHQLDMIVAGGVESMSRVWMGAEGGALYTDPRVAIDLSAISQGVAADGLASLGGFDREAVDTYAVESQNRAHAAWEAGHFDKSVIPVVDHLGAPVLSRDEHIRPGTTVESLAGLKASFADLGQKHGLDDVIISKYPHLERVDHVHHAGNASGIVDGAAGVLLGTEEIGRRAGLKPRARIRAFATSGSEPTIVFTGPEAAISKILARTGLTPEDIDLWEVNEAFAAVPLDVMAKFKLDADRVNIDGGAIAMGHPIGATGAMLLGTLLDALERKNLNRGIAVLCIGAGMGTAVMIERETV
mgnify:CR=1 FL=1